MKRLILISLLLFSFSSFSQSSAFIYGSDTICSNENKQAQITIDLTGTPPWNIVYAIDGVNQPPFPTTNNPHIIIPTKMAGVYTIVSVSDAVGTGTASGSAIVTVLQAPTADFSITNDTLSLLYPSTRFRDKTISATAWSWEFGDGIGTSNIQDPTYTFDSIVRIYQVTLIAYDINGCSDTTFHQVWVNDEYYIYIPSSFTPDWDGVNDKFCLYYHAIREHTFDFKVYNLRGDVVFHTKNIKAMVCDNLAKNGWDGTHNKSGKELPIGNYVYEVYFQDFEGWKHHDFGFLHLIR